MNRFTTTINGIVVEVDDNGCWFTTMTTEKNPRIKLHGVDWWLHYLFAYWFCNGWRGGMFDEQESVERTCDNLRCFCPQHLCVNGVLNSLAARRGSKELVDAGRKEANISMSDVQIGSGKYEKDPEGALTAWCVETEEWV